MKVSYVLDVIKTYHKEVRSHGYEVATEILLEIYPEFREFEYEISEYFKSYEDLYHIIKDTIHPDKEMLNANVEKELRTGA